MSSILALNPGEAARVVAAKELRWRRRAKEQLLSFTEYTHPSWSTGKHHHEICAQLMRLMRGEIHFLAVFAPPRHSKSELVSRRFPAFYLGHHPTRQVLSASAVDSLSTDLGADVRNLVNDRRYKNVFSEIEMRADTRAKGRWHTTKGGIYYAVSVGGTCVGRGAHLGIIDDPHGGRNKSQSDADREKVHNWYTGEFRQRLMRPHSVLLTLTRWHEDDLAGRLLPPRKQWVKDSGHVWRAGRWTVLDLEAIQDEGTDHETALWPGQEMGDPEAGDTLAGYPLEYLQELRKELIDGGKARDWYSQYQQKPAAEAGTYIQRAWFINRYDPDADVDEHGEIHPEALPEDLHIYMASDIAVTNPDKQTQGTKNKDPDWTEHGVFGYSADRKLYVLDWWSGRTESDEWVNELLKGWRFWKPLCWFTTRGTIQNAVNPIIRTAMKVQETRCRIEYLEDHKDKHVKGRSFQVMSSAGDVLFPKRKGWAQRVIDQCVAFDGGKHDDKFDAMSNICRAIELAHPAIVRRTKPVEKPRERWQRGEVVQPLGRGAWMTV